MRYVFPCLLFLTNDECFSALALVIIMIVFLFDMWKAKEEVRKA